MRETGEAIRNILRERGEKYPNKALTILLDQTKQAICDKVRGRHAFTLRDLALIERKYDIDAETWKRLIHNYQWGEEKDDTKPT